MISEALIHDERENNQRVPTHHHDHQSYHEDRQKDHRVPGERSPIRADARAVGARGVKAGNHCQIEDIWRTSNRSEVIVWTFYRWWQQGFHPFRVALTPARGGIRIQLESPNAWGVRASLKRPVQYQKLMQLHVLALRLSAEFLFDDFPTEWRVPVMRARASTVALSRLPLDSALCSDRYEMYAVRFVKCMISRTFSSLRQSKYEEDYLYNHTVWFHISFCLNSWYKHTNDPCIEINIYLHKQEKHHDLFYS